MCSRTAMTRMPSAEAIRATLRPMLPTPMSPRVAPATSRGQYPSLHMASLPQTCFCCRMAACGNLLCQSEDQRDDMLGDNRPVDFGGVRQDDLAVDQLRKEKLVHRRCGSVNPPQIARRRKLLRPQGYRKDDLGIAQMLFNAVVRVALHDFDFRKVAAQPLPEPRRSSP